MGWQTGVQGAVLLQQSTQLPITTSFPRNQISNATLTLGPFNINQSGYEVAIGLTAQPASTTSFEEVTMTWTDSVTGQIVGQETWWLGGGNGVSLVYFGTGPTKGDTLTVTLQNWSSNTMSIDFFTVAQMSRTLIRDDWRSQNPNLSAVPGESKGTYDIPANNLFATSPSVSASSSTTRQLPLYSGIVQVNLIPGGNASGMRFVITDIGDQSGLAASTLWQSTGNIGSGGNTDTNTVQNPIVTLPRSICHITLINDASVAQTPSVRITIQEQPP